MPRQTLRSKDHLCKTFFRRGSRKYGDRVFLGFENFLDHALFPFGQRPFSLGSALLRVVTALFIRDRRTILKWRGGAIGQRVKLGSGVFCPEKYLSHASFKSKEMAILEAIVMFILY